MLKRKKSEGFLLKRLKAVRFSSPRGGERDLKLFYRVPYTAYLPIRIHPIISIIQFSHTNINLFLIYL